MNTEKNVLASSGQAGDGGGVDLGVRDPHVHTATFINKIDNQ